MPAPPQDRPIPPELGPADPRMTCMGLVEDARAIRTGDDEIYRLADLQERIVLGELRVGQDATITQTVPMYERDGDLHENAILPAVETYVARVSQGRVDSHAWPRTPHVARIAAAEGANLLLDSERAKERRDQKVHELLFYSLIHGRAGAYTTWDKSIGPHDSLQPKVNPADGLPVYGPDGQVEYELVEDWGAVRVEVLSAFDYWTSGEDDPEYERWQVRRRVVDKWSAKAALAAAGFPGREPAEQDVDQYSWGRRTKNRRGVEVLELWVRPGSMIEKGAFVRVVDNCVTQVEAFPYKHGRLPIATLTQMRVRGTPHGHTKIKDAIWPQKLLDVTLRSIVRRAEIAGSGYLVGHDQIIDGIDETQDGRIRYNSPGAIRDAVEWVNGGTIPPDLFSVYQLAKSAIRDVIGVSEESVTGGDAASVSSGEQLKTASALDSQKTVPARRRLEVVMEEVDKQKLSLHQQFMTRSRLISVVGDPVRAGYFSGADFDGVDVALEQSSGLAESHLGRARNAEERGAAGLIPPQDTAELSQTGLGESVLSGEARQRVQMAGAEALRGRPQMAEPGIPPQAAVRELRSMLRQVPQGQTALLLQLIAQYERMASMPNPGQAQAEQGTDVTTSTKEALQAQEGYPQ